jgi:signal transduction histidine kinase
MRKQVQTSPMSIRALQRSLMLAFFCVTASFVAATAYSQLWVGRIHEAATEIARSSAPSIEALASARADLSALGIALRLTAHEQRPVDEAELVGHQRALATDIHNYLAHETSPQDRDFAERVAGAGARYDATATRIIALLGAADFAAARPLAENEALSAATDLGHAITTAMTDNAEEASALALSIEASRRWSIRVAFALNVACAVAAIFAALVVSRVVHAYAVVAESRNELLGRRADELETFANRVAHDIVGPLGTISMGLELIAERVDSPPLLKVVERAQRSLERSTRVVHDLLAFARANAKPARDADCDVRIAAASVAEDVVEEAHAARVLLRVEELPACHVACSPGVLDSVLSNLVRNAIKFTAPCRKREVVVRGRQRGDCVEIEVVDTGPGIESDKLATIWLPFVRGSAVGRLPGMGLGLATVKRLIEAHGGSVSVSSELERGSTFSIRLPARGHTRAAVLRTSLVAASN